MDTLKQLYNFLLSDMASKEKNWISFFDIDETLFHTTAKIGVVNEETGERYYLDNTNYNTHKLGPNEKYDYSEFRDADLFYEKSTVIKKNAKILNEYKHKGRVIFLTARGSFYNKFPIFKKFLEDLGIDLYDKATYHLERTGDREGAIDQKKVDVIKEYLSKANRDKGRHYGIYRNVLLMDDSGANINTFIEFAKDFPNSQLGKELLPAIIEEYKTTNRYILKGGKYPVMTFLAIKVNPKQNYSLEHTEIKIFIDKQGNFVVV